MKQEHKFRYKFFHFYGFRFAKENIDTRNNEIKKRCK